MRIALQNRRSGIALIMVLLVCVMLMILAGAFAYSMKVETQLARNASFDNEFLWFAWAGVDGAKYELAADLLGGPSAQVDSLNEWWAGGPGSDTNVAALFPDRRLEFAPGKFVTWTTIDLDRKFNINMAGEPILRQAMTLIGVDPASHSMIMDSVMDWIDRDKDAKSSGAEDDFYQSGQGPYGAPHFTKNGFIDDISELLMIKGVTPAIYYGSGGVGNVGPMATVPQLMQSRFDEPMYAVGLRDLFTPVSGRTLNINTADITTLQLLPPIDINMATEIVSGPRGRAGPDQADGTQDDTPFRSPQELVQRGIVPEPLFQQISQYLTVRSLVFEVTLKVNIGGQERSYTGVVRRNNQRDMPLLTLYPRWDQKSL
jgi:type II secretory pathway component PulK